MNKWTFSFDPKMFVLRLAGCGVVIAAVKFEDYIMAMVGIVMLSLWWKDSR